MSNPAKDFAIDEVNLTDSVQASPQPWWRSGYTLAIASAAAASSKAVLVKLAYAAAPVSAIALLNLRMLLSLPLFILLYRSGKGAPLTGRQFGLLIALGFCGYYFSSFADFTGLHYVSAGLERLILFTYPSFVVILEALVRRKRISRRSFVAIGLSYLGLGIAFAHDMALGGREAVLIGGAWILASSFSYALYYLGTAKLVADIGSARFAGGVGIVATVMMMLHGALVVPIDTYAALPATVWWLALAMAVVATVLPSWLNAQAMTRLSASEVAVVSNLGPVLTIAMGWLVLAEPFSLVQVAGMALVVFGVSRMSR